MLHTFLSRIGLSLLIVFAVLLQVVGLYQLPFVERLENHLYDTRLRLTMPRTQDSRIVIVDIDEKSLQQEGRWPWQRDRLAKFVNALFEHYQVAIVGFDVVFAEKDESSGLKVMERLAANELRHDNAFQATLAKIRPSLERDRLFAESLRERPVVLSYYFRRSGGGKNSASSGGLPPPVKSLDDSDFQKIPFVEAHGYGGNLPMLQQSALGSGYFDNPIVDRDGVYRRVPLLQVYEGNLYEAFSLAVTRALLGSLPVQLGTVSAGGVKAEAALEWLEVGGLRIPVDDRGAALVPYRGPQGSFPYVSAVDVLSRKAALDVLEGAIVLVGTTAPGLQDLRSTPVQNVYPGVEIHANLISGFLDQTIKHKPGYTVGVEFVELLLVGFLLSFLLPRLSALWSVITTLAILAVAVWINVYAWKEGNIVVPLGALVLLTLVLFIVHMSYGFFVEGRTRRHLAKLFGQYVPPELVDEMSTKSSDFGLAGDNREMTVLFSDVRNFTTISEGLSPTALTRLMNEILTPMTEIIHKHRGTIDKYMGDAIMAFWGAPLSDPDHGRHALQAALEMIEVLPGIQEGFRERGWPEIRMGVGLHTGMMNVGNMGSQFRMAYTVLGDAVNLGSRLEGLTKQYGVSIIVSQAVKEKAPDYAFRELDRVRVKGKDEPVTIFEPLGLKEDVSEVVQEELRVYDEALRHYRDQSWDLAQARFCDLKKNVSHGLLYHMYTERIALFRAHPPGPHWDGVYVHKTK